MNENEMVVEALKWILKDIKERKNESEKDVFDDFSKGRRLAYNEVLDIIESRLDILGIEIDG